MQNWRSCNSSGQHEFISPGGGPQIEDTKHIQIYREMLLAGATKVKIQSNSIKVPPGRDASPLLGCSQHLSSFGQHKFISPSSGPPAGVDLASHFSVNIDIFSVMDNRRNLGAYYV